MTIDTIPDSTARVQYTTVTAQSTYTVPFPFFDEADLVVYADDVLQTLGTDYDVSGAGEDEGGVVTILDPYAAGVIVTIYRNTTIERTSEFQQNGPFLAAAFNTELDRITLVQQELRQRIAQCVRIAMGDTSDISTFQLPSASDRENKYMRFGTGGILELAESLPSNTLSASSMLTYLTNDVLGTVMHPRSVGETYANVTPKQYAYPSSQGYTLNVWRFFTQAQIDSCIAEDSAVDMTTAIQAANNYLEGLSTSGGGGQIHPGGTLYFPNGVYNITGNIRVGGNVKWKFESLQGACLSWNDGTYTGTPVTLGPDASGIFPWSDHVFGASMENARLSFQPTNAHAVGIGSAGAHQGCHLYNVRIEGVNQIGIQLGDTGGPAYFWIKDVEITGGTRDGLPTTRQGIYTAMGSICEMDTISIEGAAGHNFDIGIRQHDGSGQTRNLHFENTTTGVYFDTGGTNATSVINGISGNSSVTQLVWIPSGYTGTVIAMAINGRTGDPSHPIGIRNDNTGEALVNVMHGIYVWSGTAGDMSRVHNALQIVPSFVVTYSASMTPDAAKASKFFITATNSTNFTINAPLHPIVNQRITFTVRNTSGGALGTATWNAIFKMAAWTQPASATSRSISFDYDGANWVECSRTTVDVPN